MGLFFIVIIIVFAPIVLAIVALVESSKVRTRISTLEHRLDLSARSEFEAQLGSPQPAPSQMPAAAPVPPVAPSAPEEIEMPPFTQIIERPPSTAKAIPAAPTPPVEEPVPVRASHQPADEQYVAHSTEPARKPAWDWEAMIAGNWLNRIGIVALLVASAFFLKYAFDNNWIGPVARVGIGLAAGSALLLYSRSLFKKGFVYFSEGIVALGGGVLYLSIYAGWNFYHFIAVVPAFLAMAAITALILGISFRRDTERLALLALAGGFLTPLLLNTGKDAEIGLFTYLAVLNAGLFYASYSRNWRSLPIAFAITLGYGVIWYLSFYEPSKLVPTVLFATVFFVEFGVLSALRAVRQGTLYPEQIPLTLLNTTWFTFALVNMLYDGHRALLTVGLLALAGIHFFVSRRAPAPAQGPALARIVFEVLAVTLLAVATAVAFQGRWITIGWAVESAALVYAGLRASDRSMRIEGLALFAIVIVRLLGEHISGQRFILNEHFATFAIVIACAAFAAFQAARKRASLSATEVGWFKALEAVPNALAVWALSAELWHLPFPQDTQILLETLLWSAYAGVLVLFGSSRRSPVLQWQGLALMTAAIFKAFVAPASGQTEWICIVWALEAAGFVWGGFDRRSILSRATGIMVFIATIGELVVGHIDGGRFIFNPHFETFSIVVVCLAIAMYQAREYRDALIAREAIYYKLLGVAANALAVWALTTELWSLPVPLHTHQFFQEMLWTTYAGALMFLGAMRTSTWRTWQSLALLLIAACNAFTINMTPTEYMVLDGTWAVEGAAFVWAGFAWPTRFARTIGFALLGLVSVLLLGGQIEGGRLLLNPRFATFLVTIASLGFVAYQLYLQRSSLSAGESGLRNTINVVINVLALWGLSAEVLGVAGAHQTKQLVLTVLWTGYAAVLMTLGLRRGSPWLRWQSISLLTLVILKVVVVDLSELALGLRIVSFFALGVVLMGVSFFYQRRIQARASEEEP